VGVGVTGAVEDTDVVRLTAAPAAALAGDAGADVGSLRSVQRCLLPAPMSTIAVDYRPRMTELQY
jgi:hypothetical protein